MPTLHPDPPYVKPVSHPNNRFMALTSNCTDMPTLFVDTHAPLDVLYDAANYRYLRTITLAGDETSTLFVVPQRPADRP